MIFMKRIIKTTAFGAFAAAVILVSGCTKNYYDCPEGGGEQNRITLSSEVEFGPNPRLQDKQIVNGQSLSLFVTRAGSVAEGDQLYANNRITANGSGGFTYRVPMYYPSDGTKVDFYGIHPYSASAELGTVLPYSIQTDQTEEANYLFSDLLFGVNKEVSAQINAVPLTFYHKLSRLDFVISTTDAAIDLNQLTALTILGLKPETSINIQNGNIDPAAGTATTIQPYGTPVVTGAAGNQTVTGYTAIVVPQSATARQQLFGLMINGEMRYYTPDTNLPFVTGTKYTVTLNITGQGIILSSQIEDWTDGGSIGGPVGPQ